MIAALITRRPDKRPGLAHLKQRFTLATLSSGDFSPLTALAKRGGLPWDCVISAEMFGHYKPDLKTYLGRASLLDLAPAELMLAACATPPACAQRSLWD